jgi:hypothetical protein
MKNCSNCKIEKELELFPKNKSTKDGYHNQCKNCHKQYRNLNIERIKEYAKNNKEKQLEYQKKWWIENREKYKEFHKNYRQNNKEYLNKYHKKYQKEKKKTDPIFKFSHNIRCLISGSFKRGTNQFRKNAKTEKILGCTIEDFIKYIESKFTEGMNLHNHGEWHLDHIKPIKLATTKEEIIQLNHYTNFQPLWASDNFKKGSKY